MTDPSEQFRAIIQRNSSDPVSTSLDRSAFVTINDAAYTEDPEDIGIIANVLAYIHPIAYAAVEKMPEPFAGFRYPVDDFATWRTSQDLGTQKDIGENRYHMGEDWNLTIGSNTDADNLKPVYAIGVGKIIYSDFQSATGFGNCVILEHELDNGEKVYSLYGHLDSLTFAPDKVGTIIPKGQQIGNVGHTAATNNHLHFEIFSVAGGASASDFIVHGTPIDHKFGYTAQASAAYGAVDQGVTSVVSQR